MADYSKEIEKSMGEILDLLKGRMNVVESKDYVFGSLFYMYLSAKLESHLIKELENDNLTLDEAWKLDEFKEALKEVSLESLGFFFEPSLLFSNIIVKASNNQDILKDISNVFSQINDSVQGRESEEDFENLFESFDLSSSKLGDTLEERNSLVSQLLLKLSDLNIQLNDEAMSDYFEYLLKYFAINSHEKIFETYTPPHLIKLMSKLVSYNRDSIKSVYDPTCGSASLLLGVKNEVSKINDFYGQEISQSNYNLARMNMTIHGVPFDDFNIELGHTLENPKHKGKKFDAIVAHLPSKSTWSANEIFLNDDRFSSWGKLSKKPDFAFLQHMLYHLDEVGTIVTLIHGGILFRNNEKKYRQHLIEEKNYLDAVILLPNNLFYGPAAESLILVLKKNRSQTDKVLFINATNDFERKGSQNILRDEYIEKIVKTYISKEEIESYSYNATIEEIKSNDFILSVSRYIDYYPYKEEIDFNDLCSNLRNLSEEMDLIDEEIKEYCDKFGLDAPIF